MDPVIVCSVCDQALGNDTSQIVNVRQKGLNSLIAKSKKLGDYKWEIWSNNTSLIMHSPCRKWYLTASIRSAAARAAQLQISSTSSTAISSTSSTAISSTSSTAISSTSSTAISSTSSTVISSTSSTTISSASSSAISSTSSTTAAASSSLSELSPTQSAFDFQKLCLICSKPWDRNHRKGCLVQNDYMKQKFLDIGEQRGDSLAIDVTNRLRGIESLTAVGARYHRKCRSRYVIPKPNSAGVSRAAQIDSAFQLVLEYIKNSPKGKFTLTELRNAMGDRCFSTPLLYRKLKDFFGEDIHILHQRGSATLIISITKLCEDWHQEPSSLLIWKMMRKVKSKMTM